MTCSNGMFLLLEILDLERELPVWVGNRIYSCNPFLFKSEFSFIFRQFLTPQINNHFHVTRTGNTKLTLPSIVSCKTFLNGMGV